MSIRPLWLNRVAADMGNPLELKRLRTKRLLRADVKIAHHIRLAFASGAGTSAPQLFECDETLGAIVPLDGQFRSNLLYVDGPHSITVGEHSSQHHFQKVRHD